MMRVFIFLSSIAAGAGAADPFCSPAWQGSVLIDCDSLSRWTVERDSGSSGTLGLAEGIVAGRSARLDWDLGTGDWVQGRYSFPQPIDLTPFDIFGISLRGGGAAELPNTVGILIADENDVFYGYDLEGKRNGINQIDRELVNLPFPKRQLHFFFSFGSSQVIDWSRIDRFFIVLKRPGPGEGGGKGSLAIDHVQCDRARLWPRQTRFEAPVPQEDAAQRAVDYILSQGRPTGLIVSWKEEPSPKAWLYDQALALILLTREGIWPSGAPGNNPARAAGRLADFLSGHQKADGHWARGWDPRTGSELADDGWVGDQAWCVMALSAHSKRSGHSTSMDAARRGADWLASKLDPAGKATASTEGNVDVWWAMVTTCRLAEAGRIRDYLLAENTVWDPDLRYWWRGSGDPFVALDAATWLSAFARHPLVGEPERAMAALGFARRALIASSDDGTFCGFDGMGPVSVWYEGTAQYVAAGGEGSQAFLDLLLSRQNPDGSMPGSPDRWTSDSFGWLSPWSGLAPTSWLYFAIKGLPFPMNFSLLRGDSNGDGLLDLSDPLTVLFRLFAGEPMGNGCGDGAADANGDGAIDLGDPVFLLGHLFLGGPGPDPAVLGCDCG